MSATILFDLDDTLLKNEMGVFMPAYLRSLQECLSEVVSPDQFLPVWLAAVRPMMGEEHLERTLLDVFYDDFSEKLAIRREDVAQRIEGFYRAEYIQLKETTDVVPGAQQIVRVLAERGYSMAIATNPLFPRNAVEERLRWAELPVSNSVFKWISGADYFHFAKPNPAYYAELLGYLGWPEEPVVMVGNDPLNDIQGAEKLGLKTYHTVDGQFASTESVGGEIEDVLAWLDRQDTENLIPDYHSPSAILAIYKSTAAILDSFVRFCDDAQWQRRPDGEWTALEVLFHLADVEKKVYLPRVQSMISEPNPFIPGVDTDAWYAQGFPEIETPRATLDSFLASRKETIRLLSQLSDEEWLRPARHAIFGPTTLLEIAHIMARHDQLHIRQLSGQLRLP